MAARPPLICAEMALGILLLVGYVGGYVGGGGLLPPWLPQTDRYYGGGSLRLRRKLWSATSHVLDVAEDLREMGIYSSELRRREYAKSVAQQLGKYARKLRLAVKHLEDMIEEISRGGGS